MSERFRRTLGFRRPQPWRASRIRSSTAWTPDVATQASGAIWAVKHRDGKIIAVAGPISPKDLDPELLQYLVYVVRDREWVDESRDDFAYWKRNSVWRMTHPST